ncbi:2-polyprenyl-3-methyl-5-hydroxy-6-metoxy-1,4-benzoquinol methylase [Agrococcus baldri]|uniref:2-polyprenyl-3-methyl-5-hydroxy-6-metoxy-1,4-benzoquinol methylase n=1 Tax=Agrococcus baldri TaxID=153730 RepID=A0AA94HKZ1_9MICO|nr:methyltransferase domain-containing protein [Agrococcus baldri]SFS03035.1 2-polyprenyl-3-methyl-5-hydroxy-6-metoxy-1,4-benzoquinol methylase [Agrococcus baldri]
MLLSGLRRRDPDARETMDDPACDPVMLARTYSRFDLVNAIVSGRGAMYRRWIRPRLRAGSRVRLLDVGTGGADLPRRLLRWAAREPGTLEAVAIDPDPRAIAFAAGLPAMRGLELRQTTTRELALADERFDVVISGHVLHHLAPRELGAILADSERLLAPGGVAVHGDIARSAIGYLAFAAGTLPFEGTLLRHSFIRADGLASIRRSHTVAELARAVPSGWRVRGGHPWRLELVWPA